MKQRKALRRGPGDGRSEEEGVGILPGQREFGQGANGAGRH